MSNVLILRDGMPAERFVEEAWSAKEMGGTVALPLPPSLNKAQVDALRMKLIEYKGEPGVAFVTSGTVGTSKVVVRSFKSVQAEAEDVAFATHMNSGTRILITTPITHSYGFGIAMAGAWAGSRVDVAYSPNVFERASLAKMYLNSGEYDIMTGVPYMFRMLLRDPPRRVAKNNYAGGEVLPLSLVDRWLETFGVCIRQEYGLSEVGIVSFSGATNPWNSIGFPIPRTTISWNGGELIVDRPYRPTSYLLENTHTDGHDIFTVHGVRTGDIGRAVDGLLYLSGRAKNILKIAGKAVACEEIENAIRQFEGVEDVVVQGQVHPVRGEVVVAYIEPRFSSVRKRVLTAYLSTVLQRYKMPWAIESMDELPRSASSGKVARRHNDLHL